MSGQHTRITKYGMYVATQCAYTVTVTNLSQASLGRPSPRALKPRLRYKLNHGVVGAYIAILYILTDCYSTLVSMIL